MTCLMQKVLAHRVCMDVALHQLQYSNYYVCHTPCPDMWRFTACASTTGAWQVTLRHEFWECFHCLLVVHSACTHSFILGPQKEISRFFRNTSFLFSPLMPGFFCGRFNLAACKTVRPCYEKDQRRGAAAVGPKKVWEI